MQNQFLNHILTWIPSTWVLASAKTGTGKNQIYVKGFEVKQNNMVREKHSTMKLGIMKFRFGSTSFQL